MAADNKPAIRVLGFHTTYENHPKRGDDPLNDNVDAKGFLLNAHGKRIMERIAEDWVSFAPSHAPTTMRNVERVRHMIPDPTRVGNDEDGARLGFMVARWEQIEPAYELWKKGQELPVSGTPLQICGLFNPGMIEVLHQLGLKTVEDVRDLSETAITRVNLPNMRDLRKQAGIFLESLDRAGAAEREAEKDAQLAAMQERLAAMEALLDNKTAPQEQPVDPEVLELRAALDGKGISYDKRWAAPKLRQALAAEAA